MNTYTPNPGTGLIDACAEAVLLARLNNCAVAFTWGGVALEANPTDTGWKVEQQYHHETKPARMPYAD